MSNGQGLIKLDARLTHRSYALGVLGMPGLTAYMGLLDIGQPQPGETVVVAAATGAVGSLVGQIAKLKGCRVVAIAGGAEKCRYAVEQLGFDVCLDHYTMTWMNSWRRPVHRASMSTLKIVGGKVLMLCCRCSTAKQRIPLCGLISQYNATGLPSGPDRLSMLMGTLLVKRIKMQGFIVFDDYGHRYHEFQRSRWGSG